MAAQQGSAWSWRGWLPDISVATARFPFAVVIAGLLTLYLLFVLETDDIGLRTAGTLAASFLWVVAVDLYVESHGSSRPMRIALWLIGIALITLYFVCLWHLRGSPPLLFASLILAVGLSGYVGLGERNSSFWMFNHWLWLGAMLALVSAVMLGAGLAAIVSTLNYLFGLTIDPEFYRHIWSVSLGFIAPVAFLAFAPTDFDARVPEGEQKEITAQAIAGIVKFVLVPLLLVYTAILYAYAVKIGLEASLPKGTLGAMVMAYLLIGAVTLLFAYPTRESGGILVRLFWRYWVWLALMPVALLFIAAFRRIAEYGLTEDRYLVVLIGIWALALAAFRILLGSRFDLRLVPGVLAFLLLAASFGPGGAVGFSVNSQTRELGKILEGRGLLVDGKLKVQAVDKDTITPLGSDATRVRDIEWYLNRHHALDALEPWFQGQESNPFAPEKKPEQTSREVFAALGLTGKFPDQSGRIMVNHSTDRPEVIASSRYAYLVGPVNFLGQGPNARTSIRVDGLGEVELELSGDVLSARLSDGNELKFDVASLAQSLAASAHKDRRPLVLQGTGKGLEGVALIEALNGYYQGQQLKLHSLRFWLALGRPVTEGTTTPPQ